MSACIPSCWSRFFIGISESGKGLRSLVQAFPGLLDKFIDFRRAYGEDGMSIDEFDGFGATARTLRQFIQGCTDVAILIRGFMIPNPDVKSLAP